jgi:3-dehydroquinate synthase II
MKEIWVKIDPWDKELVTTAIEGGADALVLPRGCSEEAKALGRVTTVAEDGDWVLGQDVVYHRISGAEDEEAVVELSRTRKVILERGDWNVIPLENLIARGADVIAQVSDLNEARTAWGVLEKGVERILVHPAGAAALQSMLAELRAVTAEISLQEAVIETVVPVGMGDRVCVDTCSTMEPGEGLLVGNSSKALFLVHAESIANPYVAPRPFRVNAGAVHAYCRTPQGRTRYLAELAAGDAVLIVDFRGRAREAVVGRLKIEKRPLLLVTARTGDSQVSTLLQNAETIRLANAEGEALSVVQIAPGDRVLVACEGGGRHFGHAIEESITEK